jgi:hypothetical protein
MSARKISIQGDLKTGLIQINSIMQSDKVTCSFSFGGPRGERSFRISRDTLGAKEQRCESKKSINASGPHSQVMSPLRHRNFIVYVTVGIRCLSGHVCPGSRPSPILLCLRDAALAVVCPTPSRATAARISAVVLSDGGRSFMYTFRA